jgi:uncharacterized protein
MKLLVYISLLLIAAVTDCQAGKAQSPANEITLSLNIETQGNSAEKALLHNNETMQKLIRTLQTEGLIKSEYHTGQFSIQPVYTPYPKNPPSDFKQSIIAYDVTNSLTIKTQRLELVPPLIDAAAKAGVTQVSNLSFGIKDPHIYRSEVIAEATAHAIQDAQVLADSAKVAIVRVLDISLDQPPEIVPRPIHGIQYAAKMANSTLFLEAPDIELNANVKIIFEIK